MESPVGSTSKYFQILTIPNHLYCTTLITINFWFTFMTCFPILSLCLALLIHTGIAVPHTHQAHIILRLRSFFNLELSSLKPLGVPLTSEAFAPIESSQCQSLPSM